VSSTLPASNHYKWGIQHEEEIMKIKVPKPLNSTLGYVLLGVILAFLINQGMAFVLSTGMPIVAVESNSMVPTFYKGDILVLQGAQQQELKIGDIIVFSSPRCKTNSPIVHRITKINPDGSFQTQGDANPGQIPCENYIRYNEIHGKSILIIPYLGWVKIGITEYVVPNALWIAIAAVIAFVVTIKASKSIKTHRPTFMRINSD
jgi:signal peptidase I